tara:strand:+ start:473 stop:610 length:138 start_codon:yes stop_codon:yes gene_type:complete
MENSNVKADGDGVGRVGRRGVKSANTVNLKERQKEEGVRKRENTR